MYDLYDLQMHGLVGAQESESEPSEVEDEASFDNRFGNEMPNFALQVSPAPQLLPAPQASPLPSPSPTRGREGLQNLP